MWPVRCFLLLAAFCFTIPPVDGDPPVRVQGVVGGVAILDFRFQHPTNGEKVTLDWTKKGVNGSVLAVRDNCEIHKDQNKRFEFTAAYFKQEWKNGNGSLRLSDLRPEDAGTYHVGVLWNDHKKQDVRVQLQVVSGPPEATPTTAVATLLAGLAMGLAVSICCNVKQARTIRSLSNTETRDSRPAGRPQQESGDLMANHNKSTVRPDHHWEASDRDHGQADGSRATDFGGVVVDSDSHQNQQESVPLSVVEEGFMPAEGNRLLN